MSRNNRVPEVRPIEEYILHVAAEVAEKGLREALKLTEGQDMFFLNDPVNSDGRIKNRTYIQLQDIGVLDQYDSYRSGSSINIDYSWRHSSRQEPKRWRCQVNKVWFKTNAPLLAVAPVFETAGRKVAKKNTYNDETEIMVVSELQNYRNLFDYQGRLSDAEMIFVYLHIDDYDIRTVVEKNAYNRDTHTSHKIYPKALLSDLSIGVFHGHAMDYLYKHMGWTLEHMLGIPNDPNINKLKISEFTRPNFEITDMSKVTEAYIEEELEKIQAMQNALACGQSSMINMQRAIKKYGGWEKLTKDSEVAFIKYLEENFPLHINDSEDKELQSLCNALMAGKNKGFNERLQLT